jgi:uncharacterized protein YggL (DUF469 family)
MRTGQARFDRYDTGFVQLGFPVRIGFVAGTDRVGAGEMLDAFHFEALEPVSLVCAGALHGEGFQGFVTRWKGSATEQDRRAISAWLASRSEVADRFVGKLMGAWYGVDRAARFPSSHFPTGDAG